MDNSSLLSKSTFLTTDVSVEASIAAKLRRLKIEENLLLQRLHKFDRDVNITNNNIFPEFKCFSIKNKNIFAEIKKMFQDIKTAVSSQEILKSIEIEDIRANILELENKIKTFKGSLQTDLAVLKSAAINFNRNISEDAVRINRIKKPSKMQTVRYTQIVPSPVKLIMNCPFKCVEVQEFQDFMKNSPNRYGGWNEYNHNIFIHSWQKAFNSDNSNCGKEYEITIESIENSPIFQTFLDDVFPRLQGLSAQDVIPHAKWYIKFITLKERQQKAIDKWRSNKDRMKVSAKITQDCKKKCDSNEISHKLTKIVSEYDMPILENLASSSQSQRNFVRKCFSNETVQDKNKQCIVNSKIKLGSSTNKSISKNENGQLSRPTKQWRNRCNNKTEDTDILCFNSLEHIKKLGTPVWRAGL